MFLWLFEVLLSLPTVKLSLGALVTFVICSKILKMILKKKDHDIKSLKDCTHLVDDIIANWEPKPLVENKRKDYPEINVNVVTSSAGKYVDVNGIRCLNFASHNYLGFLENDEIKQGAIKSIKNYGVGSCGPRGFYGTIDVHLELEEKIAKFMKAEDAVIYSYGFSTIASAISAYAKKNDIIFADEKVNFAIQRGIEASRSTVYYFKHNDPDDFKNLLLKSFGDAKKDSKKTQRKFLIVEGIYINTGQICDLKNLIEIAKLYKVRIFIDESVSCGVLGDCGRGITEHFDISIDDIDLIMVSMEYSLSQIGGFCVGSSYIVEHQRLSGLGYCFSASLPPLLTVSAIKCFDIMEESPSLFERLQNNCCKLYDMLHASRVLNTYFNISGNRLSPFQLISLKHTAGISYKEQFETLKSITDHCQTQNIIITVISYLIHKERSIDKASLRLTTSALLTDKDIQQLVATLEDAALVIFH